MDGSATPPNAIPQKEPINLSSDKTVTTNTENNDRTLQHTIETLLHCIKSSIKLISKLIPKLPLKMFR